MRGNGRLEEIDIENIETHTKETTKANSLFIFIGAKPCTDWMQLDLICNNKGYIETGRDLLRTENFKKRWKLDREPFLLESSQSGIFAAGDVRAGALQISWTNLIDMAPSPTAEAMRFMAPARTSPAAKIPDWLDSREKRFPV